MNSDPCADRALELHRTAVPPALPARADEVIERGGP